MCQNSCFTQCDFVLLVGVSVFGSSTTMSLRLMYCEAFDVSAVIFVPLQYLQITLWVGPMNLVSSLKEKKLIRTQHEWRSQSAHKNSSSIVVRGLWSLCCVQKCTFFHQDNLGWEGHNASFGSGCSPSVGFSTQITHDLRDGFWQPPPPLFMLEQCLTFLGAMCAQR
jgi:hypothetical protein